MFRSLRGRRPRLSGRQPRGGSVCRCLDARHASAAAGSEASCAAPPRRPHGSRRAGGCRGRRRRSLDAPLSSAAAGSEASCAAPPRRPRHLDSASRTSVTCASFGLITPLSGCSHLCFERFKQLCCLPSAAMAPIRNAFLLTKPRSLESIDSGMTIRFIKVNGDPAEKSDFGISSEWTTSSCETVDAVSTAVARLITRHLRIPNECLSLVWSKPQDHHVIVTIVLTPLSEHAYEMLQDGADSAGGWACLVCCQPCPDADDDDTGDGRTRNYEACEPCFLCGRCRVTTPNGTSMCYLCLGPEDRSVLEDRHSNHIIRLRVLAPGISHRLHRR